MKAERWARIKSVLAQTLAVPPSERAEIVARLCASDRELREEVESLLAASDGQSSVPRARDVIADAARALASDRDADLRALLERGLKFQYEVLRPLGRGGMGAVYLAREHALDRLVAIKVLRPDLAASPDSRERFRREARIAARLSHPGIVPLHTFGEVEGVWYFVMGYARGESLADRLRVAGRLSWRESLRILDELADALDYAHRHGVIHRDIKPANVLLDDESGRALLADFGISKSVDFAESLTQTGAVVGTPDYMSPEQAQGLGDVDERSDIYSLGAVAYTMLTGRQPFAGSDTRGLIIRRVSQDPHPVRSIVPDIPETLADAVSRCMARDREHRWASGRALREVLAQISGNAGAVLPEPVRELPSFGAYALLWVVGWSLVALIPERPLDERLVLLLLASLVPVGLVLHIWNSSRGGTPAADVARVALWPPEWWSMWWPRVLRRPSDLWPRLPRGARIARVLVSMTLVAMPLLIPLRQWTAGPAPAAPGVAGMWFTIAELGCVALIAAIILAAIVWGRRRQLTIGQTALLFFGATVDSSGWHVPPIARLLSPEPGRGAANGSESPAEIRRAIVALLPGVPARVAEAASMAAVLINRALGEVEEHDRAMATLRKDASEQELERLASRLAALDAEQLDAPAEREELRHLLEHQMTVMHRMRRRLDLVVERRGRLLVLVRAVWARLADLADARTDDAAAEVVGRLHAVCAELAAELNAATPSTSDLQPATARASTDE